MQEENSPAETLAGRLEARRDVQK